ncbi:MAG: hypothetical protein JOZ10_05970 [Acidobacteria bacterium]|nr:hypothetical protein [Acidobacteriota bacterium]MBV9438091.1 hypothetical protein [Acidobacteriota bacterium]
MNSFTKSLVVAALQVAIVLSLGGKLMYDRAHRPRVWVRTGSIDPDLPIRGRYMTLNLQVHAEGFKPPANGKNDANWYNWQSVDLTVENGDLVARPAAQQSELSLATWGTRPNQTASDLFFLWPSVAFFLPEHAEVPRLKTGDELWAEVTIPRKGPPRPIQLAMKHEGQWIPLTYR